MAAKQRKRIATALVLLAITAVLYFHHRQKEKLSDGLGCGAPCGVESWSVKTLSDADAARIDFTPRPATTMIAEIPSSECVGACTSPYASAFETARKELEARFGLPLGRFQSAPGDPMVEITGSRISIFCTSREASPRTGSSYTRS